MFSPQTRLANHPGFLVIVALVSLAFTACGLVGASNGDDTPTPEGTPSATVTGTGTPGATPTGSPPPTATPTPTPLPTPTPALAPTRPAAEARSGEGPVVPVTPVPAVLPTYWHPSRTYSISYPDRWAISGPAYDKTGVELVTFKHPAENVSLSVFRLAAAGCDYQSSQTWATAWQNFIRDTRADMSLLGSRAVTVGEFPAVELAYKTGVGHNARQEIDVVFLVGGDAYRIQGSAPLERWGSFQSLLSQLAYSFGPGPTVDKRPVPPQPADAALEVTAEGPLRLLAGSTLFQGRVANKDSYWWAEDIRLTLNLLDTGGNKLWTSTVKPSNDKLDPGDVTVYEALVPADVPAWETSQVAWTWRWACS